MDGINEWGLEIVRAIQAALSPALDGVMSGITFLGEEEFLLLFMPLLLWCVDYGLGVRLGCLFMMASFTNGGLKSLFGQPRPYALDATVQLKETDYVGADAFGIPSGHSMSGVLVWGFVASAIRRTWVWVGAVVLAILIGFSRVYLGLHFPTDVLAGWAVGAVFLGGYLMVGQSVVSLLKRLSVWARIGIGGGTGLLLAVLNPHEGFGSAAAVLIGLGVGVPLALQFAPTRADGLVWKSAVRYIVGMVPLLALYLGLSALFPGKGEPLYVELRIVRYALLGLWASLGAPWLFLSVGLATRGEAG